MFRVTEYRVCLVRRIKAVGGAGVDDEEVTAT